MADKIYATFGGNNLVQERIKVGIVKLTCLFNSVCLSCNLCYSFKIINLLPKKMYHMLMLLYFTKYQLDSLYHTSSYILAVTFTSCQKIYIVYVYFEYVLLLLSMVPYCWSIIPFFFKLSHLEAMLDLKTCGSYYTVL